MATQKVLSAILVSGIGMSWPAQGFAQPEPVEEPVVEDLMAEEPVAEEPMAEEAMVEEPVAEEPMAEEAMVEETMAEAPAQAADTFVPAVYLPYKVEIGLSTGVFLPQISSELGTAASVEIDVGVPVWKSLTVVGAIAYSQPTVDGGQSDPRLMDAMYSTETTQRELTLT